uniref:Polycystic kidney disease 1 like 2a n=1 Tax=Anabas testudineus TaxID=64144 RepID=A0A7N6C1Z9_ANATE
MCRKVLHLLILVTHSCLAPVAKDLCPKSQKAFRGSCYEFVGLQRSFSSAQAWCEQSGGHLAFIPDEDIQHFMQRHLDPGKDVWFGVAPSASTHLQYSPTAEGLLSWLDGSHITYSNWVSSPQQGAACGHILKDSGFKWEAVKDCNKRLHFICQFESGSSIVCAGRNTTLQCASGQVLMIDAGFYGHNNHHCRSSLSPSITSEHQCGRVDVVESLSAHCHGRQVCQVAEVFNTFGEPCPELGSYLSVDYHCKAGLTLTMSTVAVVFNDIHISVKWLLDLPCGNNCRLSTGDGHVIYLDPERLENGVVHKYMHPRAFVVAVECIGNGIHITVQKIITIQEPVTQIGVIGCYAGNLFFRAPNCKALYGEPFQIQMEIKAGTNVTLSVVKGNVPHNITLTRKMVKHLGPGCHQLTLYAFNMVTFPEVSTDLQVCVLEKVAGLQASVLSERNDCIDTPEIMIGVFLERGAPVLLLFSMTGYNNSSFSETREMNTRKEIFLIPQQIQGMDDTTKTRLVVNFHSFFIKIHKIAKQYLCLFHNFPFSFYTKGGIAPIYTTYTINTSPSTDSQGPNPITTTKQPVFSVMTTKAGSTGGKTTTAHPDTITANTANTGTTSTRHTTSPATTLDNFSCSISPSNGTVLDAFKITCQTSFPCPKCHYCFKIKSKYSSVSSVFLPLGDKDTNYSLLITATVQHGSFVARTSVTTQVSQKPDVLGASVESVVGQLKDQGLLSGETVGQLMGSVASELNSQSSESTQADRQKKNISAALLNALYNIQSALLAFKDTNEEPTIIQQDNIAVFVMSLNTTSIHIPNCTCPSFSLPTLPSTLLPSEDPVDIRMLSLNKNPFSWNGSGNISGPIGGLTLTTTDGSSIPVEKLSKDIEILLPKPVGEQVNISILDLGNYSTTIIDVPSADDVIITLLGTEGNSEPHHLTDQKKRLFERGAVDVFLLTTPFSLGELQAIRLWHNNSGRHPAWFVGNVVVQDLQTNQKWHFLCNSWLAIDMGACSLDKVFPVSTEMDLKRFSNLFFMKATKDFSDGHLWYSVINRPPSSTFTCVQRVSCCFSLLLCTMLTSVMFYGIPKDPSEQVMDLGQFEFTWQQFMVGVQSSLIMFPVNFLIVTIFRQTCPREMSCCKRKTGKAEAPSSQTATTNMSDITRIAHSLSKNVKSNIPCQLGPGQQVDISDVLSVVENFIRQNNKVGENTQKKTKSFSNGIQPQIPESSDNVQAESTVGGIQKKSNKTQYLYRQLCHIHKQLSLLGPSGFPTPHGYNQALQQVQRMKGALEDRLSPADGSDGNQKKKQCCHGGLPWWFIFVGWLLVIATSFVAGFFTMLYGLKFGKPRSISWLVSMIVSFFQSVLIIQPLKVLCLAVFFALVIKKVDENDFENVAPVRNYTHLAVKQNRNLYEPPPVADIEKMKKNKIMEQKAYALFREILIYLLSMCMLLLAAYAKRDPSAFYLNQHILNSFTGQLSSCMSIGDVFAWANKSLLSNLFGVYPGFITDGNSKLVGNARLRQLRVRQNSCQTAGPMQQFVPDCNALYSWEVEDMGSYNPGWNHSLENNMSTTTSSPWKYQTQAQLRAYHIWGTLALYRGGGFVTELGPDLQNASSTLEYLFSNQWLDAYTRAIFVEFTVFNANVNLFCIVTLLLETPAIGAFQFNSELHSVSLYQSGDGLHLFVVAAQIIYLLFTLYYMFLQCKLMKQQRWAYFRNKWHLLELAIILLSWSAVGVFIKMILLGNRDMTFYQNHKNQFASFYGTAKTDSQLQYLIAFLVLLCSVKLWHLLRLNPNMYMITSTLQRAWSDISSFLVVIVVMFLAYSTVSNVIYGWKLPSYRTLEKTLLTLVGMQIGIFNYDEVLDYTPLLGGFIFGSCVVFMTFVVLNLLISVILVSFNQERIYHKVKCITTMFFELKLEINFALKAQFNLTIT